MIEGKNLTKIYKQGEIEVRALNDVTLAIQEREFTVIAGPSGSGKTTLLNLLGGLDVPSYGSVSLGGKNLSEMSASELTLFRRDHIGFVFQAYNLIPVLSVEENIEYVMLLQKKEKKEREEKTKEILAELHLEGLEKRKPYQLSGGQQQRVAVARAIVANPSIILADEPTANLDSQNGLELIQLMLHLNQVHHMTFLFSTHDPLIIKNATRVLHLKDGRIE